MDAQPANSSSATDNRRKVFLKTYGCQMNVYDSQRMSDALARDGYVETTSPAEADLILLNTCHIREKAAEKVYSELGRMRQIKEARAEQGNETQIAIAGCVAQAEGAEILRRAPAVDLVVGPQSYHRLGEYLKEARDGKPVIATEFAIEEKFSSMSAQQPNGMASRSVTAFLTVQEGCDKFCTFCVVPYTRGPEVSRSARDIIEEARRLAESGVREVTLLGQNVNAWHGATGGKGAGRMRLGELLAELSQIDGLARLRYTTSHPIDMDEDLIAAHRELPKLMPYLHLPIQAGSDRVLKEMNRHHTSDYYLHLVEKIRAARPDIALSGDFIVGFPGESEAEFEDTLNIVRQTRYASAFSFKYSPRPGTPGAGLPDQISDEIKSERLQRLQALLAQQQQEFNLACQGRQMDVLIEKPARRRGQIAGRSPWLQPVVLDQSAGRIGEIVRVTIDSIRANSLMGTHCRDVEPA